MLAGSSPGALGQWTLGAGQAVTLLQVTSGETCARPAHGGGGVRGCKAELKVLKGQSEGG